ncbi:hypothetical protein ABH926_007157 [Catenulispora sp. GP43]|uniref:hypothetical protein n=1 Tax=Catenulispora sp. GP43 TaxID=3156263 RepID=UPI003519CFE9
MAEQPTDFFTQVSATALAHPDVATGTMMGFPCLRVAGAFFASCDHRTRDYESLVYAGRMPPLSCG